VNGCDPFLVSDRVEFLTDAAIAGYASDLTGAQALAEYGWTARRPS
jgi:hypothetical protein